MEWVVEGRLARSARPDPVAVAAWMNEAQTMGIRSILCLLDDEQLRAYAGLPGGLLATYRRAGFTTAHLPIRDLQDPPIPKDELRKIWEFYQELPSPLLIHCWAGMDRTGAAVDSILRHRREGTEE